VGSSPMSDGYFGFSVGAAWWNLSGWCVFVCRRFEGTEGI
jgi:hypothetical protein